MTLYSKNGGPLVMLPFQDAMPDGSILTDLANQPASRAALGYVEAPCPQIVSMMQLRVTLARKPSRTDVEGATMVDDVDDFIATKPKDVQQYWKAASEVHRNHWLLAALITEFGMSEADGNDIFTEAKAVI